MLDCVVVGPNTIKDIANPPREPIFDRYLMKVGELVLIKDMVPATANGIYKLKKYSHDPNGKITPWVLKRKVDVAAKDASMVWVQNGICNEHTIWTMVRHTRKRNFINFQRVTDVKVVAEAKIRKDDVYDDECDTESELRELSYGVKND
jgi:hypothetical protein